MKFGNQFLGLLSATLILGASLSAQAYPLATIHNNTEFAARGTIFYASAFCSNDQFVVRSHHSWRARHRGSCLISKITAVLMGRGTPGAKRKPVVTYSSSPVATSYSVFQIQPTASGYRIYSNHEYARSKKTDMSPGFRILNKTKWPIAISLSQVGCLYHGVVQPGKWFRRDTGAVWFTIYANVAPDGKDPKTDWDCIKPVGTLVGSIALGAAAAGLGAFMAVPEYAGALAAITTSSAVTISGAAIAGGAAAGASSAVVKKLVGNLLVDQGSASKKGQYAGPPWPGRCNVMPTYELTGGPGQPKKAKGGFIIEKGTKLKLTKTNTCGNGMM
jgi:hypothetical protein